MKYREGMAVIDSHTHWGPSAVLGLQVSTEELLLQAKEAGVERVVIFPFPSTALQDEGVNEEVLQVSKLHPLFIPYYYIPEDLKPIPRGKGFFGGKWHWVRGVQDCSSNYRVLEDPRLGPFIEEMEDIGLPMVFEEELAFTQAFVAKTRHLRVIIPHMGLLGGRSEEFLEAFAKRENVYFDTSLASPFTTERFVKRIGPHRVIFGSDVPFGRMKTEVEKVLRLPIRDEDKEAILGGNLRRILNL